MDFVTEAPPKILQHTYTQVCVEGSLAMKLLFLGKFSKPCMNILVLKTLYHTVCASVASR